LVLNTFLKSYKIYRNVENYLVERGMFAVMMIFILSMISFKKVTVKVMFLIFT
jgi:hypothetical protein